MTSRARRTRSQNRQNRGFDINAASPLAAAAAAAASANCPACASLKGGLLFAGAGGQPSSAFNTQYGHVQPRIGVSSALRPTPSSAAAMACSICRKRRSARRRASRRTRP